MVMPRNPQHNPMLGMYGATDCSPSVSRTIFFNNQNAGVLNNCHYATNFYSTGQANGPTVYGDCPGGLNFFPNVGSGAYTTGNWGYLEWCGKSSTTLTSRDGIYKWAVNGQVVGNYNQSNTGDPWTAVHITQAWDGTGVPWGVNAWWDADRFVVAKLPPGGCANLITSTGGVIITPPPPPTGPIDFPVGSPGVPLGLSVSGLSELPLLEEFK
jgi:hypothetical protein